MFRQRTITLLTFLTSFSILATAFTLLHLSKTSIKYIDRTYFSRSFVTGEPPRRTMKKLLETEFNKTIDLAKVFDSRSFVTGEPPRRTMKELLETEFNKTIDLAKLFDLRAKANIFASNILIPLHQQVNYTSLDQMVEARQYGKYIDRVGEKLSRHRTCAVVGNGGILRSSGCGSEIDAHDFVMRSNMAPIKDFANDVGNKTNIMSVNNAARRKFRACMRKYNGVCNSPYGLQRLKELKNAILWFSKVRNVTPFEHFEVLNFFARHNLVNISLAYPFKYLSNPIKRFFNLTNGPSSGLFLYTAALPYCDMISLYGFYPFSIAPDGRNLTYHYASEIKFGFKTIHNIPDEYNKLVQMNEDGYFRMVTNKCNLRS
ncbi:CMP-N-acetylneuraminate-poly-alpha-2,8-sialyltransferase-like [Antedon mediterranea]|uniref:CMP-N-acetylneuraminate-poly-alpha-2, 8-sialyltransferase-like n=1 Tax=Antedon mediterranea TaxID=105859 RepID=UPI003AF5BD47